MTELQQKELEIFEAFDAVCRRLAIPYFLVCGSALGAEKYQGFIPWDDDLDIGMYREDYERFCREAPAHLPEHLFLQNAESDPAFPQIYSKLRDGTTTFLEEATAHLKMHHGVYIDLFPLDGYPERRLDKISLEWRKRIYCAMLLSAAEIPRSPRAAALCRILRALGAHRRTQAVVRRYTRMIRAYPTETSELICNHGNWQGALEYAPKAQYGNGRLCLFEGRRVRIPEDADAYLTQKYGNWRAELPEEKQRPHHGCKVCDTKRPYTEYRA